MEKRYVKPSVKRIKIRNFLKSGDNKNIACTAYTFTFFTT